ncbi:MAG: V-type ATP synthase subunit D [Thermoplasmatota archaeon]
MSIKDRVKPTRSELLELKKKIRLSERGHRLLKMKRDTLIMEFFSVLKRAKNLRAQLVEHYRVAERKISMAMAVEGAIAVRSAAFAIKERPEIRLESKNVMGVVVPLIESRGVRKKAHERGYGVVGASARIDEAARAYEELVENVIVTAEVETTIRRLLDEIDRTRRRVNALEFKVIPELREAEAFIALRLEELERDNIFRLKRIKG